MRVSVRGWARDHGRTILFEEDLAEIEVQTGVNHYPYNGAVYQFVASRTSSARVLQMKVTSRIHVTLSGNYMLEVRLSPSDVMSLFWWTFKERSFRAFFEMLKRYDKIDLPEEEIEEEED